MLLLIIFPERADVYDLQSEESNADWLKVGRPLSSSWSDCYFFSPVVVSLSVLELLLWQNGMGFTSILELD